MAVHLYPVNTEAEVENVYILKNQNLVRVITLKHIIHHLSPMQYLEKWLKMATNKYKPFQWYKPINTWRYASLQFVKSSSCAWN